MTLDDFLHLEPWDQYHAYLQLKASLRYYGPCLLWNEQDIDLIPGMGRNLVRQVLYYFASGEAVKTLHPVCNHRECVNPSHCYPIKDVAVRKICWDHIHQLSKRLDSCVIWCGGPVKSFQTCHAGASSCSVAQLAFELHYGVKFFAKAKFTTTCGVPGCITPSHFMPANPAFVQHWQEPTNETLAQALLWFVTTKLKPSKETGCRVWPCGTNNGRSPVIKIGTKRYSVHKLLHNYAYGPPPPGDMLTTNTTCSNKMCVEPNHIEVRGLRYADPKLGMPTEIDKADPPGLVNLQRPANVGEIA